MNLFVCPRNPIEVLFYWKTLPSPWGMERSHPPPPPRDGPHHVLSSSPTSYSLVSFPNLHFLSPLELAHHNTPPPTAVPPASSSPSPRARHGSSSGHHLRERAAGLHLLKRATSVLAASAPRPWMSPWSLEELRPAPWRLLRRLGGALRHGPPFWLGLSCAPSPLSCAPSPPPVVVLPHGLPQGRRPTPRAPTGVGVLQAWE